MAHARNGVGAACLVAAPTGTGSVYHGGAVAACGSGPCCKGAFLERPAQNLLMRIQCYQNGTAVILMQFS